MQSHWDLNNDQFEEAFQKQTLDPTLFNHIAHLRLTWIHVTKYGKENAIRKICNQIKSFDQKFGDGTKFNEELTKRSVDLIDLKVSESTSNTFQEFLKEFPELESDFMGEIRKMDKMYL